MTTLRIYVAPSVKNDDERKFHNSIPCTMLQSLADAHCSMCHVVMLPIDEHKTWTLSEFCTWKNSIRGKSLPKCIYSVLAREMAKHRGKFGWPLLSDIGAVMKPRHEPRWNLLGCRKLANWSRLLVGSSSPYYGDMRGRYCCLTGFFRLSIHTLIVKIQPDKVVRWCAHGDFFVIFASCIFSACSTFQTSILNSHWGHIMCRSMVDIQSATAEIRRGKKWRKKKPQLQNMMAYPIGWP